MDANGHVWFAEANTDLLVEFFPTNQSYVSFPIPTQPHLAMIWFLVFDQSGNLWFADPVQSLIWKFVPSSHSFSNYTTNDQNLKPYGLAYNPDTKQIWFTSVYSNQIGSFQILAGGSAQISSVVTLPTANGKNTGPSGITLDSNGNVFVSESFASKIVEYDPQTSSFVHVWNLPGYAQPVGIRVDQQTNLIWFADHASSLFGYVNMTSDSVTQIATSLFQTSVGTQISTTISLPYWLTLSNSGEVWFDEHYANRIARYDPKTFQLDEFQVPTNGSQPLRFQIDEARNQFWFTEFTGNNLGELNLNASAGETIVTPRHVSLDQASPSFVVNLPLGQIGNGSFSGSMSYDGFISSNLTFSYSSVNSTATKVFLHKGSELSPGNYTLTVCPDNTGKDLFKSCSILEISVGKSSPLLNEQLIILVGAVAIVAGSLSTVYLKRRRK